MSDQNSKRTRVEPVFSWLAENGDEAWATQLLALVEGFEPVDAGRVLEVFCTVEVAVAPSTERLIWMIENVNLLVPRKGSQWRELRERVLENPRRAEALNTLRSGGRKIPAKLILEGKTKADCLVACEDLLIWIEGKRNDSLDPSIDWDVTRDQLARNVEAAWILAEPQARDFRVVVCHEGNLKHHEQLLIDGYRAGTWAGGWPHLDAPTRRHLGGRIGTLRWTEIVEQWPALRDLPPLADVPAPA